jgi:hypothetical protein
MKIPRYLPPLLVLVALFGGYAMRTAFTQPTTQVAFSGQAQKSLTCTVQGLKCKGTAMFFTNLYSETPGIASIETYATEHRAIFKYDPAVINADSIRRIMEAPIPLRDGTTRQIFVCLSSD